MFSEIRPKGCNYGCGVELYWNTEENTYFELYSRKKHMYPNKVTNNTNSKKKSITIFPPPYAAKPKYYDNNNKKSKLLSSNNQQPK